jgi:hypothetical protein
MNDSLVTPVQEAHAARWHEWQLKNEAGRRRGSRRAGLVFTLIVVALGLWFGWQLVS